MEENQEIIEEQPKPEEKPEEPNKDLQAIMARLDELAKDIAEVKARQDKVEDEEDYEEIAY